MNEHLSQILTKYSLRIDLIDDAYIDPQTYKFKDNVPIDVQWDYYKMICSELRIKNKVSKSNGIDSEGGRKMKIEGHENELSIRNEIISEDNLSFLNEIIFDDEKIEKVFCDGKNTKKVPSIFDKKTTSKTDLKVLLNTNRNINLSVKKSKNGQVHLNKVDNFINGYEKIFSPISENVKAGLLLLFSGHKKFNEVLNYLKSNNEVISELEQHHKVLTIESLKKYNPEIASDILTWFKENIGNIVTIVFKKGWASEESEWVDYILYRNKIDNDYYDGCNLISVDELRNKCVENKDQICFGKTTIHLPFGHLQYHLGGLQFHHNHKKISNLICKY